MADYIHVGNKIQELLEEQHLTKKQLGEMTGMATTNAVYLTKRESVDVQTLHKVGTVLKYNFWKHFVIEDGERNVVKDEKDGLVADLNAKIKEQERVIAELKRERELQKQEIGYLKEINALLKGK